MNELTLYFDGACEPRNPGGTATGGFLILDGDGSLVYSDARVICSGPEATNNLAEWCALGFGLRAIADGSVVTDCGATSLAIRGDSQLVINQINGAWRCRDGRMARLKNRCAELLGDIGLPWTATWIPREQNERADALSRLAYEKATGKTFPKRQKV